MPRTWAEALKAYCYPVDLSCYPTGRDFPGFFEKNIAGDRETTIEFEGYFREQASVRIEVWYEVAFWKLRSRFANRVAEIAVHTQKHGVSAHNLWEATQHFVERPDISNLKSLRGLLGLSFGMALPLTFVAFFNPAKHPMVDKKVALWVNGNRQKASTYRGNKLIDFRSYNKASATYIRDSDFDAYLKWMRWCQEVASVLSTRTNDTAWRARDVEMAIFTAYDKRLRLNDLP